MDGLRREEACNLGQERRPAGTPSAHGTKLSAYKRLRPSAKYFWVGVPSHSYTEISMLDMALSPIQETSEFTQREINCEEISPKSGIREPRMVLCSQVRGRQRWYVDVLEDNRRLAAAVELVLRSEEGILGASVNPLTGRILVHHDPELLPEIIEAFIHRAIEFGPMSREEFSALRPDGHNHFLGAGHLIAAEIGCSVIKMLLLGGGCPIGLAAAAGILLLFHWRS
jgi:hypothetical protein